MNTTQCSRCSLPSALLILVRYHSSSLFPGGPTSKDCILFLPFLGDVPFVNSAIFLTVWKLLTSRSLIALYHEPPPTTDTWTIFHLMRTLYLIYLANSRILFISFLCGTGFAAYYVHFEASLTFYMALVWERKLRVYKNGLRNGFKLISVSPAYPSLLSPLTLP